MVDVVQAVNPTVITERDAKRAGFANRAELLGDLDAYGDAPAYRIEFHVAEADPRAALRRRSRMAPAERAQLTARLARFDAASRCGPWTTRVLRLIGERPGTRAADLAGLVGRDRLSFKADVRKLKDLGLTESLEVGYRLSPRGRAVLSHLANRG